MTGTDALALCGLDAPKFLDQARNDRVPNPHSGAVHGICGRTAHLWHDRPQLRAQLVSVPADHPARYEPAGAAADPTASMQAADGLTAV
ncbi:MAG: hypothetical protein AAF334_09865 [Pseudomonadota bacterium]